MERRQFLATGLAGLGLATAGCSSVLGNTVTLTDPEQEFDDDGQEKYLIYRHDGTRIVTVGFDQRTVPASLTDQFGFRITASHSEETTIDQFRFDLRAPQTSVDPPADIYLKAPQGGLWSDLNYEQIENSWTRIALDDTGSLGDGTISLETIVDPGSVPAEAVGVRGELTLSDAGTTYSVEFRTEFEPVTA